MKTDMIKIWTTVIATSTAVVFLILYYLFQDLAVLLLSIEVILLPAIYVIGNILAESVLQREHEKVLEEVYTDARELERKYYNLAAQYEILRRQK